MDVLTFDGTQLLKDENKLLLLGKVLTSGRNNGMANMITVIQNQIQTFLTTTTTTTTREENHDNATFVSKQMNEQDDSSISASPSVAMLLSGGVDSAVALNLLKREGYNVTAFYLKIWLEDELAHLGQCPWEEDYEMCRQICQQAQVPLQSISLQQEYKHHVMKYTLDEARQGRTPNPDIMCNSRIKFGCFYQALASFSSFDYVASGHYAQIVHEKDHDDNNETILRSRLFRAPDPVKDQSYFLCTLDQEQLSKIIFPLGHFNKTQVRQLAHEMNLPNKDRRDSQGLCFLGKIRFPDFLRTYLGERPGPIVEISNTANNDNDDEDAVIGRHQGVWFHTVGQRKGIGPYLFPEQTSRGPWYVVAKDTKRNIVYASNQYHELDQARRQVWIEDIKWIAGTVPRELQRSEKNNVDSESPTTTTTRRFQFKIRHGPRLVSGSLSLSDEQKKGWIYLDEKDGGLAPGQFVVIYRNEECLGSGVISEQQWDNNIMFQQQEEQQECNDLKYNARRPEEEEQQKI